MMYNVMAAHMYMHKSFDIINSILKFSNPRSLVLGIGISGTEIHEAGEISNPIGMF